MSFTSMKVGQIGVLDDGGGGYWVGKIVELKRVVWDPTNDAIQGDVVVHEYGNSSSIESGWLGPQHALFKGKSGPAKEVKPGQKPAAGLKPLQVTVWAEAFVMWDSEQKMLQPQGRKLKKKVIDQL